MIFGCDFTRDNLLDSNRDNPLSYAGDNLPKSIGDDSPNSTGEAFFRLCWGKFSNSTGDILYSAGEYSYTPLGNIKTFQC